jgi:rod shape-determining protein MreD
VKVWIPTAVAIVIAAVLQAALAPHMAILGVTPNFLLLVVVTLAMVEGSTPGAVAGFVAGLLFDLLGSGPIGPGALVLTGVGYLAGTLANNMFAESWLMPVSVVFVASLLAELAYGGLLAIIGVETQFLGIVWKIVLPGAIYNTALAVLIYPWLARFLRADTDEMTELRGLR